MIASMPSEYQLDAGMGDDCVAITTSNVIAVDNAKGSIGRRSLVQREVKYCTEYDPGTSIPTLTVNRYVDKPENAGNG